MKNNKVTSAIKTIISNFKSIDWVESGTFDGKKGYLFCYLNNYFLISRNSEDYFFSLLSKNEHSHDLSDGPPTSEIIALRTNSIGEPTEEHYGFAIIKSYSSIDYSMVEFHHLYGCFGFEEPNEILDFVIETEPPEDPTDDGIPF